MTIFQLFQWTRLCSTHFTDDCWVVDPKLIVAAGAQSFAPRRQLKPDAIPTIFSFKPTPPKLARKAFLKRERAQVRLFQKMLRNTTPFLRRWKEGED